jgi:uncharacterized protein YdcH (DUF465 family)
MLNFLSKLFDSNAKQLGKFQTIVDQVNTLEDSIKKLKDKELPGKTAEFKKRIQNGESLDDILPEALATIRESSSSQPSPSTMAAFLSKKPVRVKRSLQPLLATSGPWQIRVSTS